VLAALGTHAVQIVTPAVFASAVLPVLSDGSAADGFVDLVSLGVPVATLAVGASSSDQRHLEWSFSYSAVFTSSSGKQLPLATLVWSIVHCDGQGHGCAQEIACDGSAFSSAAARLVSVRSHRSENTSRLRGAYASNLAVDLLPLEPPAAAESESAARAGAASSRGPSSIVRLGPQLDCEAVAGVPRYLASWSPSWQSIPLPLTVLRPGGGTLALFAKLIVQGDGEPHGGSVIDASVRLAFAGVVGAGPAPPADYDLDAASFGLL